MFEWALLIVLFVQFYSCCLRRITGTVPTFSGGDAPVSISESLPVGSSVAVASLTDDLGEQLMWSDLGSPYFEYNQTTGT